MRRLVFGPQQPQLDALDRKACPAQHETREFPGVFTGGLFEPLLAQLGHLGRFTGDHLCAAGVPAQDPPLDPFGRPIGVSARDQADHLDPGGQAAGDPVHPYRDDRAVLTADFELLNQLRDDAGRRLVGARQPQHLDLGFGVAAALCGHPFGEQILFGR